MAGLPCVAAGASGVVLPDGRARQDSGDSLLHRGGRRHDRGSRAELLGEWTSGDDAAERLGEDVGDRLTGFFTGLSADDPDDAEVLDLFGAGSFIPARASDYDRIEQIGRELGLVT